MGDVVDIFQPRATQIKKQLRPRVQGFLRECGYTDSTQWPFMHIYLRHLFKKDCDNVHSHHSAYQNYKDNIAMIRSETQIIKDRYKEMFDYLEECPDTILTLCLVTPLGFKPTQKEGSSFELRTMNTMALNAHAFLSKPEQSAFDDLNKREKFVVLHTLMNKYDEAAKLFTVQSESTYDQQAAKAAKQDIDKYKDIDYGDHFIARCLNMRFNQFKRMQRIENAPRRIRYAYPSVR